MSGDHFTQFHRQRNGMDPDVGKTGTLLDRLKKGGYNRAHDKGVDFGKKFLKRLLFCYLSENK